jgi:hypothetical protein
MAVTNLTKISDNKQPVKRISADVVARSAAIKRNSLASRSPFAPPSFPPAIEEALNPHSPDGTVFCGAMGLIIV